VTIQEALGEAAAEPVHMAALRPHKTEERHLEGESIP
jgi:hypothetical protein